MGINSASNQILDQKSKDLLKISDSGAKAFSFEELYGIGYWLKKYARYPTKLPIRLHADHAPSVQETLLSFDLGSKYSSALFHNKLKIEDNLKVKKFKQVYIAGSGFVHYRKMNKVEQTKEAKGTVCFPMHSTDHIEVTMDWQKYMDELETLPDKYKPVSICLYFLDIKKGLHIPFLERGFEVTTAGHYMDRKFAERFYEIIRTKKYVTSNEFGSFVPYAVEMGIPFFYYGTNDITLFNSGGDQSAIKGKSTLEQFVKTGRKVSYYDKSKSLFNDFVDEVTPEQRAFAEVLLGVNDAIGPAKLNYILWREYLRYGLLHSSRFQRTNALIQKVKSKIQSLLAKENTSRFK